MLEADVELISSRIEHLLGYDFAAFILQRKVLLMSERETRQNYRAHSKARAGNRGKDQMEMNGITIVELDLSVCGICSFAIDADFKSVPCQVFQRRHRSVKLGRRKIAIVIGINPAELLNVRAGESKTGNQLAIGEVQFRSTQPGIVCPEDREGGK